MAVGLVLLGSVADTLGRRPIILGCLVIMFLGMLLAASVSSIVGLLIVRFVTGLGIGGMLAITNAMVAEYSSERHRNFNVALMAAGYPVGIMVGGSIASALLAWFDWHSVFLLGAGMTALLIPLVRVFMPESILHLA